MKYFSALEKTNRIKADILKYRKQQFTQYKEVINSIVEEFGQVLIKEFAKNNFKPNGGYTVKEYPEEHEPCWKLVIAGFAMLEVKLVGDGNKLFVSIPDFVYQEWLSELFNKMYIETGKYIVISLSEEKVVEAITSLFNPKIPFLA